MFAYLIFVYALQYLIYRAGQILCESVNVGSIATVLVLEHLADRIYQVEPRQTEFRGGLGIEALDEVHDIFVMLQTSNKDPVQARGCENKFIFVRRRTGTFWKYAKNKICWFQSGYFFAGIATITKIHTFLFFRAIFVTAVTRRADTGGFFFDMLASTSTSSSSPSHFMPPTCWKVKTQSNFTSLVARNLKSRPRRL